MGPDPQEREREGVACAGVRSSEVPGRAPKRQHCEVGRNGDGDGSREVSVRSVEDAYDKAWCDGDLDALMRCLSTDAVLVNPRGEVALGHDAIRLALGAFLSGEAKGSRHGSTIDRVTFVREDVAVVDGSATITFQGSGGTFEHRFTDLIVRDRNGRWVIQHVRAYVHDP